jgi:hypothetical protein
LSGDSGSSGSSGFGFGGFGRGGFGGGDGGFGAGGAGLGAGGGGTAAKAARWCTFSELELSIAVIVVTAPSKRSMNDENNIVNVRFSCGVNSSTSQPV